MKRISYTAWLIGFIWLLVWPQAGAEENSVSGKDRIDVPAIGDGLCLHNLFQTGMVLQRDKPIRIWGWAAPGENVTVTFGNKTQACTAVADRSWKVELPAQPASSEPRALVVQGKDTTLKLEDILLGDVCSPATVKEMSGIGYIFTRRIHMATQIPIGVIDASRGGTCIETWLPLDLLKTIDTPEVKTSLSDWGKKVAEFDPQKDLEARGRQFNDWAANMKKQGKEIPANRTPPSDMRPGPVMDMNKPGNCYASMIAPIAGFQIKGAIWHQGYNNALVPNGHVLYHRHAWGRNPLANLKADGIPLDTLRNDNFTVADTYEIYTGKKSATPNILDGVEFRDLRSALKAENVKRRLKEAEAFIKEHQDTGKAAQK